MTNLVYGRNSLLSFLETKSVEKVYLQNGFSDEKILNAIKSIRLNPIYIDTNELNRLTNNGNHQGVVGVVKPYSYSSLSEIITFSKKKEKPLILILDEINDPHNFGAIIRSADAFSVDGIIIKNHNQVPVNPTVYKVSTGAINHVKIAQVSNIVNAIKELKKEGYWIYAADGCGKEEYQNQNYSGKNVLIMGSEGFGISRLVLENSDFVIKIPMTGHVNSLNVSVATGIILARIRN